jgi:hypothetical protein
MTQNDPFGPNLRRASALVPDMYCGRGIRSEAWDPESTVRTGMVPTYKGTSPEESLSRMWLTPDECLLYCCAYSYYLQYELPWAICASTV